MSEFSDRQNAYYTREINRALPATSLPADMKTIQAALGVSLPDTPGVQVNTATGMFQSVLNAPSALVRDAECRLTPHPGPAMRDPGARAGCGWWFVPDTSRPSVGAYGTRRGPMNPTLDTTYGSGEWMWDLAQAQMMESQKQVARIPTCADIQYSPVPNVGWCTTTNKAIVTDGAGNPLYPQMAGGDCPDGSVIMNAADCPPVPPAAGAGAAPAPSGSISGTCPTSGPLPPACLQQVANWYCSPQGTLSQALSGGFPSTDSTFQSVNRVLKEGGFTMDPAFTDGGVSSVQSAIRTVTALQKQANAADGSRTTSAASNLCYGTAFDPCNYPAGYSGPIDPTCITKAAQTLGYSADGAVLPGNSGDGVWASVRSWDTAQSMLSGWMSQTKTAGPQQLPALKNVYGITVNQPKAGCNTSGVYLYRYYFAPSFNFNEAVTKTSTNTHFLGRYLLKQNIPFQGSVASDMAPAGGFPMEFQRYITVFRPTQSGTYQFQFAHDDHVRMFVNGQLFMDWQWYNGGLATSTTMSMSAGAEYLLEFQVVNAGGTWGFGVQYAVNGGTWGPLPAAQLYLPYDRRLPMLEFNFSKMLSSTRANTLVADTNGIMSNTMLWMDGLIGNVNGKQCLAVSGTKAGLYNFLNYSQGIRPRALKSITMWLQINSVAFASGTNMAPTIFSLYNTTSATPTTMRPGWPQDTWDYTSRTQDWSLFALQNQTVLFQYTDKTQPSVRSQYASSIVSVPWNQWNHLAIVFDDDGNGLTFYVNGKSALHVRAAGPQQTMILEQFRVGCDATDDGAAWTGGIAWFRAFDYALTPTQIQADMADNWSAALT